VSASSTQEYFAVRDAHRSSLLTLRREAGQGTKCPGLVTSINNVNTALDGFTVDKLEARCTRLRKNLGVAAKWLSQSGFQAWMLTFTYRDGVEWEPCHVREALQRLRVWLKRAHNTRLRYVWVMETKARKSGAEVGTIKPHFHVVVWMPVQVCREDLKLDARGFWLHGMTNVEKAVAAVRYVMKYASKFDNEGAFPKGARCYGIGGLDDVGGSVRRWINWPAFVQARAAITDRFERKVGGGWIDRATGEWFPSEFGIVYSTPKSTALVRLHDHGKPSFWGDADIRGPFNWIRNTGGVAAPAYL
jgi:hypothetical protein